MLRGKAGQRGATPVLLLGTLLYPSRGIKLPCILGLSFTAHKLRAPAKRSSMSLPSAKLDYKAFAVHVT